ncbi:DoxX family protein [Corallococcus sp. AB004]|uniref:DoxX family protein n=1 Tax=Corallococcus TaxID=83461 RepID=UPI000EA181B3|nr:MULTISPECIES: DoxX family protein [Corallococcus]RKI36870.1 DoxX family protein [Corallococcus sp. AB004]NPC69310.1 DoxX family protein [Corallococcus exiguus]NPD22224.1 DoxX family protein [Corallococcus exiguus]NRD44371.1 DoxX family protein [Corallococcus exiguus]RKI04655.1 DoxX family protein [Corallococcus sp. AB038B]
MGFLRPHAERIYALLRIAAGLMFMLHGMQKLFGMFGGVPAGAPPFVVYGAGGIEFLGGLLVALGLFAGPAAFISSGTMAFAFFMGHVIPNGGNLIPIQNQGELAALYCFVFFYIAAHGSGIWSVDAARRGNSRT